MANQRPSSGGADRLDRLVTVGFVIVGAVLFVVAIEGTVAGWGDLQLAVAAAEDRPRSRVVLQTLNREILAAFVGAVLFASGVLRWRQ